jgi:hypothetical protein
MVCAQIVVRWLTISFRAHIGRPKLLLLLCLPTSIVFNYGYSVHRILEETLEHATSMLKLKLQLLRGASGAGELI